MEELNCTLCVLCGGLGTRIREVSGGHAKAMIDIDGQPLLFRVLINSWGTVVFEKTLLLAGYRSNGIRDFVLKNTDLKQEISMIVEEKPLGTGGAVINALNEIKTYDLVIINGDTLTDFNIVQFIRKAREVSASCAIGGIPVKNLIEYGALEINVDNTLTAIHEKKLHGPGIANCGVVYFQKAHLKMLPFSSLGKAQISLENDILTNFNSEIHVFVEENAKFLDVGTPERLMIATKAFKESGNV